MCRGSLYYRSQYVYLTKLYCILKVCTYAYIIAYTVCMYDCSIILYICMYTVREYTVSFDPPTQHATYLKTS